VTGKRGKYTQETYSIIDGARKLEPDFLLEEQRIVLDAKYKSCWGETLQSQGAWESAREDVFQILAYMGVFNCLYGGVIFPVQEDERQRMVSDFVEEKRWPGRSFVRIPYVIPSTESAKDFRKELEQNAADIAVKLKELIAKTTEEAIAIE